MRAQQPPASARGDGDEGLLHRIAGGRLWLVERQSILSIEASGLRAGALSEIAAAQAKTGEKGEARKTFTAALGAARRVDDNWGRASALASIAATLMEIGLK